MSRFLWLHIISAHHARELKFINVPPVSADITWAFIVGLLGPGYWRKAVGKGRSVHNVEILVDMPCVTLHGGHMFCVQRWILFHLYEKFVPTVHKSGLLSPEHIPCSLSEHWLGVWVIQTFNFYRPCNLTALVFPVGLLTDADTEAGWLRYLTVLVSALGRLG